MKSAFFVAIMLLGFVFFADAKEKKEKEKETQTQSQPTVNYEIIQQGTYSGIKDSIRRTVTTKSDWEALWKKHTSVLVPQPLVPEIDFSSSVVAVIFTGEKRTSGYQILLKNIEPRGNDVVVHYKETTPPANSFTLQVLTQPFLMLKIPKPAGSVTLTTQESEPEKK